MGGGTTRTTIRASKTKSQNIKSSDRSQQTQLPTGKKEKVFISFHMEDEAQVNLLRHQAKSDKFNLQFVDYSVKKPFTNRWKQRCEERIKQSSITVVMIGADTYKRPAVLWEINKSYELGKKVVGVRIHKDKKHPIPGPLLRNKAKIVDWKMEKMQKEIDKKKTKTNKEGKHKDDK